MILSYRLEKPLEMVIKINFHSLLHCYIGRRKILFGVCVLRSKSNLICMKLHPVFNTAIGILLPVIKTAFLQILNIFQWP